MRSIKAGCIALAVVLCLCIANVWYLGKISDDITSELTNAKSYAGEQSWDRARTSANKALDEWNTHELFLGASLRHNVLDDITVKLHILHQQAVQQSEDEFITTCREAVELLNIMKQTEIPTLKNLL